MRTPDVTQRGAEMSAPRVEFIRAEMDGTLDEWRGDDAIFWDDERAAWIVTGYDEVASILEDAKRFWRDIPMRDGAAEFWGRHLLILEGRDHRRLHALHMKLTGEDFAEGIRGSVARIAGDVSTGLVEKGTGELAAEYADKIPFLVGCTFLGLDTSDETLMERLLGEMRSRGKWKEALHAGSGVPFESSVAREGYSAVREMASALLPTIRARRQQPADDLISAFWREGATIFPDWNESDLVSCCWSSLDNETKPFLRCLLYVMCRDENLQAWLREDHGRIAGFVEEGLRYLSPFRTMRRVAKEDVSMGGKPIKAGDSLYLVTPIANRDGPASECPHSFAPERPTTKNHFAFGLGAGYCVGRYVGRVEAIEAVRAILTATSRLELDREAVEPPTWSGEMYHSVYPLHAILR